MNPTATTPTQQEIKTPRKNLDFNDDEDDEEDGRQLNEGKQIDGEA